MISTLILTAILTLTALDHFARRRETGRARAARCADWLLADERHEGTRADVVFVTALARDLTDRDHELAGRVTDLAARLDRSDALARGVRDRVSDLGYLPGRVDRLADDLGDLRARHFSYAKFCDGRHAEFMRHAGGQLTEFACYTEGRQRDISQRVTSDGQAVARRLAALDTRADRAAAALDTLNVALHLMGAYAMGTAEEAMEDLAGTGVADGGPC